MDAVDVARWQFAITTVYHFLFVPITIGMSLIVAIFHTQWLRTRNPEYLRLTKFYGKLFIINFALGLVTGIVQEFQFGMNWSDYSRFVGDIFGAPLAFEALLAFFLESTFIGIWVFGWGRIPEKLHATTMWLVHIGTVLSAYFILAANSFMQNPVGYRFNPETGRAEMADFMAVLTNKVQLVTFPHVIFSAYMVGGAVVMGVGLWLMRKHASTGDEPMYRKATRFGAVFALVASLGVIVTGDIQGKIMTEVQPMKMAAAEGLYETTSNAPFSVLSIGSARRHRGHPHHRDPRPALLPRDRRPGTARSMGINDAARQREARWLRRSPRSTAPRSPRSCSSTTYTPMIPLDLLVVPLDDGPGLRHDGLSARRDPVGDAQEPGRHHRLGSGSRSRSWNTARSRSSRTASAGSSPRPAASRGSSTG
jgi:hypothetical protein